MIAFLVIRFGRFPSQNRKSGNYMGDLAEPLARLITELKRLQTIGQESAQRIAFHLLRAPREEASQLPPPSSM